MSSVAYVEPLPEASRRDKSATFGKTYNEFDSLSRDTMETWLEFLRTNSSEVS